MKNASRNLAVLATVIVVAGGLVFWQRHALADFFRAATQPPLPPAVTFDDTQKQPTEPVATAPTPKPPVTQPAPTLPATFNLAVPFTTQAPLGNWDAIHEDTCEEATIVMADAFYRGEKTLDPQATDDELLKIVDLENKLFDYYQDTTAAQTAELAQKYFGYKSTKLLKNPTVDDLKKEVLAGHPVLVPAAGQQLGNPYFTAPGPIYHMILVRGWTSAGFITNDPGTRHGEGYVYATGVLMNAMHDWDQATRSADGPKVAFVIEPNP
jgi:hypothetical protein